MFCVIFFCRRRVNTLRCIVSTRYGTVSKLLTVLANMLALALLLVRGAVLISVRTTTLKLTMGLKYIHVPPCLGHFTVFLSDSRLEICFIIGIAASSQKSY